MAEKPVFQVGGEEDRVRARSTPGDSMDHPPIVVMSFNRPDKLNDTLLSLKAQRDADIGERRVHLFQDGAVNKYSRIRYATDQAIADCIDVFTTLFPAGTVHASPENIGICENFDRAENFVFDELRAECAYFFEDDLVLSPAYLKMLDLMRAKARNIGNVAYFAAYGDYYAAPMSTADLETKRLIPLDHHWGFGLFGRHRAAIREEIAPYLALVKGSDYARRDHNAIYDMYEKLGSSPRGSSQDGAKARASAARGFWRCNTVVPFARYEGDVGAHMSKELFDQIGFGKVVVASQPVELSWPEKPQVSGYVAEQRELFRTVALKEMAALRAGLPRLLNPMRPCTRADVDDVYRLFLGRDVERQEVYDDHLGGRPVFEFVRSVCSSTEFRGVGEGAFDQDRPILFQPATREDIRAIYRLVLHREPEEPDVALAYGSKIGSYGFCRSKLKSQEAHDLWNTIEI